MKFKKCSCCQKELTTKEIRKIGRNEIGLWVNCKYCESTMLLRPKKLKEAV